MPSIPQTFTPANLDQSPNANQLQPIAKVSLGYTPPTGHKVTVVNILAATINGVDVLANFDSIISPSATLNPTMVTLGRQLWRGNYLIGIAQRVEHVYPTGTSRFSTGSLYNAGASWNRQLPLSAKVYREHGLNLPTGLAFMNAGMDPIWSRHLDAQVIAQVVGTMRQLGETETISMINVRNTSFVNSVEPLDRFDGPVVNMNGAVSDPVPYYDIEVLYDLLSNSRGYLWGVDYIINSKGRVVFLCSDSPGRVPGAPVTSDAGSPDRPAAALFGRAIPVALGASPVSVFAATPAKITSFDWFLTPALTPDLSGVYPAGGDTNAIGKILAFIPKTGESFVIYDSAINAAVFNGTVTFRAPVSFASAEAIKFYRVTSAGATAIVNLTVWLNRQVTLVGPHSHIAANRLNYFWNSAVGVGGSLTLQDKLIAMAGMKAKTEKSIASLATFAEAILGCPLSPFDGAFVTELRQPDILGYVPGQIGIYGALQEFDINLTLPVKVGDPVTLLQSLTGPTDGVTITDIYSDSTFMKFSPDGTPPAGDASALAYVRSKIIGPISLPADFVSAYPAGTGTFLAAEILKTKSFRINLGVYASRRFFQDSSLQQTIFSAIDSVKPSGVDYWIRLADGTTIIKAPPVNRSVNVSSNLNLPTDNAQRIYNDAVFATGQFFNFYITTLPGSASRVGDQYQLTLFDTAAKTSTQTLSLADLNGYPLFPMDAIYTRWAADINLMAPASTFVTADVFNHTLRIQVNATLGALEQTRYTTPYTAFATQIAGDGNVVFSPSVATPIAPTDISRVFRSLDAAVGTMNGHRELAITAGTSYLNLTDFGAGPYDATTVALANPSTTPYTAAVGTSAASGGVFAANARVGRLRLEGYAYSDGYADGSITIGFSAAGGFTTGNSLKLTISHSDPTVLAAPVILSRTMLITDTSFDSVFAGMAKLIMTDSNLMQYFTADYPTAAAPAKLVIAPIDPDDTALSGFTFTLDSVGAAPTLYIANSTNSTTAAGPISKPITPSAPPTLTVSFTWGTFPVRTAVTNIFSKRISGGGNFFSVEVPGEVIAVPAGTSIIANLTVGAGAYGTINRIVTVQNMRVVVNNYPEYSRDDNFPISSDALKPIASFPTSFTDGSAGNPAISVPNPVPMGYYQKNETYLDATPRLISPSKMVTSNLVDDYALIPIYLLGVIATRPVTQSKTGPTPVTISFLTGSSVLYLDNADGTFSDLVLGTDYTEASPNITLINTAAHPAITSARVIGYVKSPDYLYYYEGPRAPSRTVISRLTSAAGIRALYDETAPFNAGDFRKANSGDRTVAVYPVAYGTLIPSPYGIADYKASVVPNDPAFGTDTEVAKTKTTVFTAKRVK